MCQRGRSRCSRTRAPRIGLISLAPEGVDADRRSGAWRQAGRRRDVSVHGHWPPLPSAVGSADTQVPSRAQPPQMLRRPCRGGRTSGAAASCTKLEPATDASRARCLGAAAWLTAADACAAMARTKGRSPM